MKKLVIILGILAVIGAGGYVYWEYFHGSAETQTGEATGETPTGEDAKVVSNKNPDLTADGQGLSKATVTIRTTYGDIRFKFYPADAPNTVNRIIELINEGFYDGLGFHRIVPGFVVQGGDPLGNGTGGSGKNLKAEFNSRKHIEGTVAMARSTDPDSADSQFYVTLGTHPHLDNNYTVFGQVIEGMHVVQKLKVGDKMTQVFVEPTETPATPAETAPADAAPATGENPPAEG